MKPILLLILLTTISLFGQTVGGNGVPGTSTGTVSGPAGGSLTGTYPNPGLSSSVVASSLGGSTITPAMVNNILYVDGVNGAGIGVAQAAYSSSTAYPQCAAVSFSGGNYLAVAATTGVTPGTNTLLWYPVPNAYTPTQADCAFYIAASRITSTAGQDLRFGAGLYATCIGAYFPTVTTAGSATVSVHGGGPTVTIIKQTCNLNSGAGGDGYAMWYLPDAPSNYLLARFEWEGFTLEANNMAPAVANIYGAQQFVMKDIDFRDATRGSDHYVEFGDPSGSNAGWDYEATLENLNLAFGTGEGSGAIVSTTVSGGAPVFSVTSGGANYNNSGQTVAYITGTAASNGNACTTMGTTTPTIVGGVVTGVTSSATGCVSPVYTVIYPNVNVNYGFKFSHMTDSHFIHSLISGGVGGIDAIYVANISSENDFFKSHPIAVMNGIQDSGNANSWIATQMDTIFLHAFDFEGATSITNVYGTAFEWNNQSQLGSSDYYFGTIANPGQNSPYAINIYGDACGNKASFAGYNHFVSAAGSIDGGTAAMPPFVNISQTTYCSQTNAALNTPANYVGQTYAWSNGTLGNVWDFGMGVTGSGTMTVTNPEGTGQNQGAFLWNLQNNTAATSSQKLYSPVLGIDANFWNGASVQMNVQEQLKFGSGTNPSAGLAFTMGGTLTTGAKTYSFDQPITLPHLIGSTSAPTVAGGTGAGTSPTLAVVSGSTDLSGYVTATTGTTPTASAAVFTLTFNVAYTVAPKCLAWPANAASQALVGAAAPQIFAANTSTSVFVLTQGATALAAATAYEWGFTCTQ